MEIEKIVSPKKVDEPAYPEQPAFPPREGIKHDGGKLRWSLVPMSSLRQVVDVITFGAGKYSPNNWKLVSDPKERYSDALLRHITSWMDGERNDLETGIHHLAHAGCNILFLLWFEGKDSHGK